VFEQFKQRLGEYTPAGVAAVWHAPDVIEHRPQDRQQGDAVQHGATTRHTTVT
jgi:hypothetical protein